MSLAPGELIAAVIVSKVLAIANINQAIVATPTVGIDDALRLCFAPDMPPSNPGTVPPGIYPTGQRLLIRVDIGLTICHTNASFNNCIL
jgi:hypothetical protein